MASHLDLEEQEQLDAVKHFWKRYGNVIVSVLIAVLVCFSAWNGWNWWQRDQATKAGAMFDELERAAQARDADKAGRIFGDLKDRYARTSFAQQGGLLNARVQAEAGLTDAAKAALTWVGVNAPETEYQTIAKLRLAGLLLDAKQYDDALKQLDSATAEGFEALAEDRRGDVLLAQGKTDEAKAAYKKAWQDMDSKIEYRRLIEAKLTSMGSPPEAAVSTEAAHAASAGASK